MSLFNFLTESNSQDDIRDCLDDRAASLNTQTGPKAAEPSQAFRSQRPSQTFRAQRQSQTFRALRQSQTFRAQQIQVKLSEPNNPSQTLRAQHQSIILSGVS